MKARPILFSGAMIRALLDGRKTQTRRIVKPRRHASLFAVEPDGSPVWSDSYILDPGNAEWRMSECPYGVPGDLLWARETWSFIGEQGIWDLHQARPDTCRPIYRADGASADRWWPSIHMPRWASRLTLEITEVRVERLQEISEVDALAEGLSPAPGGWWSGFEGSAAPSPAAAYALLWEHINGEESWDANPWVWAVSFRVHQQNVDAFLKSAIGLDIDLRVIPQGGE